MKKIIALVLAVLMLSAMMTIPAIAAPGNQNFGNVKKVTDDQIDMSTGARDAIWDYALAIPVNVGDFATGTAYVLWSDKAIYVFTEVNDSTPFLSGMPDDGEYFNAWETDSVEVFIAVAGDAGDLNARTPGNYDDACWQFRIDREGMPSSYQRNGAWTDDFLIGTANNKDRFQWAAKQDGGKYSVKFKITMLQPVKAGELGIQFQINDKADDDYGQVRANDASGSWNCDEFGFVVLVDEMAYVAPVAAVEEPVAAVEEPVAAVVTAAPAPTAPRVGDSGIIIFAAVMVIAAAGVVVFRKQTAK